MKILWLYKYVADYDFDNWLHMRFAQSVARHQDVSLMAYGPNLHVKYDDVVLLEYNQQTTLHQIRDVFKFDVIIVNTKSRCFDYYNPTTSEERGLWLPKDFGNWHGTPKIMLEEDYHYEKDDTWYKRMKFDLILQRHYSQSLRTQHVPMRWLPFSVDTDIFKPDGSAMDSRAKKIAFIGSYNDGAYAYRKRAIQRLMDSNIGANYGNKRKTGLDYIQLLRNYIAYLSCGSIYEITASKNFEIMACGGVLLTNKFQGIELLFSDDCYCSYKNDMSDVLEKGRKVISDFEYVNFVTKRAVKCIREKHSHRVRINQLLDIIKELL